MPAVTTSPTRHAERRRRRAPGRCTRSFWAPISSAHIHRRVCWRAGRPDRGWEPAYTSADVGRTHSSRLLPRARITALTAYSSCTGTPGRTVATGSSRPSTVRRRRTPSRWRLRWVIACRRNLRVVLAKPTHTISQRRVGDSDALDCDLTKSGYYYVSMGYKPQRTQVRGSEHRNATEATCGMRWGVMTDCTVCNGEHLHASVWVSGTSPIIAASVRLSN